jgi:hypothetical protein
MNSFTPPGWGSGLNDAVESAPDPRGEIEKAAGSFTGLSGIEWHTQRDVTDPGDEAMEGVDGVFDSDGDVSAHGFLKMLEDSPDDDNSEVFRHLTKCGVHLLKAQAHNVEGDHDECHASLNKAMFHFSRAHLGLKAMCDS